MCTPMHLTIIVDFNTNIFSKIIAITLLRGEKRNNSYKNFKQQRILFHIVNHTRLLISVQDGLEATDDAKVYNFIKITKAQIIKF